MGEYFDRVLYTLCTIGLLLVAYNVYTGMVPVREALEHVFQTGGVPVQPLAAR